MDTKLFVRKQSGGMFAVIDKALTTGSIWWVDSGSATGADSSGYGRNPDAPFLTLDYAIGQCTANNGDIIYVMPGHAETYSTTGAKNVFDVAGLKVIGLGSGSDRPTFTFSHTGATQTVSAVNTWLENLLFVAGVDSITTLGTISGADCTLKDIETRDAAGVEVITDWTVTGDRLRVYNYFKNGDIATGDANVRVFSLNGVDGAYFAPDCRFITKVTTAIVGFVSNACTGVSIDGGTFFVAGTSISKSVVDTVGGSTWVAHGYDLTAGAQFSGGGSTTLAVDDVSAVASIATSTSGGVSIADSKVVSVATVVGNTSTGVSTCTSLGTATSNGISIADSKVVSVATVLGNTSTGVSTCTSLGTATSNGISIADSKVVSVATVVGNTSTGVSTNTSLGTATSNGISIADSKVVSVATVVGNTSTGVSTVTSIATVLNSWDIRTIAKSAIALDGGTVNGVFTVNNSPVEVLGLVLLVTTAVSANNCTMKWQNDPDLAGAATTDLCGTVDIISAAIGDMFATVGASGSAAVKYASGTATGLTNTVGAVALPGAINLVLANADPSTGIGTAYLIYRPLVADATVTAA